MTYWEMSAICDAFGIDPRLNWYQMSTAMKENVLDAANSRGYRKPKNANGSRGRYFAAYLSRVYRKGKG